MNKEVLIKAGIDYDDGMHRFCNNAAMFEKYLKKLTELSLFDDLKKATETRQFSEAFAICHKLKAFIGNLSIPCLYDAVCELTEILRSESINEGEVSAQLAKTGEIYRTIVKTISEEASNE